MVDWNDALDAWRRPGAGRCSVGAPLRQPGAPVASSPTGQVVRDALAAGGTLLDVGCGDGWLCAPFVSSHRVVGVEDNPVLARRARAAGVEVVQRPWPACANDVDECDIVTCAHTVYDVADLEGFLATLDRHARRSVVVELSTRHPLEPLRPAFRRFLGFEPPRAPGLDDFLAVARATAGVTPHVEVWRRPGNRYPTLTALLDHARGHLGLADADEGELREALDSSYTVDLDGAVLTEPVEVATVWWTAARAG